MAQAWLESWWLIGTFVVAAVVSLIMFDVHNTRPWHLLSFAAWIVFMVVASGVHTAPLTLTGIVLFIGLVIVGIVIRIRDHRRERA
ncbi:hypothetical protein ACIA49_01120 [Kribbella sp. NPDC051587]|uniref:hypothetical protein n=1 Tax=Kribbella sp. NPDC051587 TaxID=3364119 RepID=UPI0037B57FEF